LRITRSNNEIFERPKLGKCRVTTQEILLSRAAIRNYRRYDLIRKEVRSFKRLKRGEFAGDGEVSWN
jgi:hypothetical protein